MEVTIYTNMVLQPMFYPEGAEEIEDIELTGNVEWEGGDMRYMGYYYLDDASVKWNKEIYTDQQNKKIQEWVNVNYDELDEHFCTRHFNKMKEDAGF